MSKARKTKIDASGNVYSTVAYFRGTTRDADETTPGNVCALPTISAMACFGYFPCDIWGTVWPRPKPKHDAYQINKSETKPKILECLPKLLLKPKYYNTYA